MKAVLEIINKLLGLALLKKTKQSEDEKRLNEPEYKKAAQNQRQITRQDENEALLRLVAETTDPAKREALLNEIKRRLGK